MPDDPNDPYNDRDEDWGREAQEIEEEYYEKHWKRMQIEEALERRDYHW